MYLELAEEPEQQYTYGMLADHGDSQYIFVPDETGMSEGNYVREDFFDGLSNQDWSDTMDYLSGCNPDLSARGAGKARRAARRAQRVDRKAARGDRGGTPRERVDRIRGEEREGRTSRSQARKDARHARKMEKTGARLTSREIRGETRAEGGGKTFDKVAGVVEGFSGRVGGAGAGFDVGLNYPWYQKPEMWALGGLLALGGIYLVTKK